MAERDRPRSATGDEDQGFLRRWSRRKAEARTAATAATDAPSGQGERAPASREQPSEPEKSAEAAIDPKDLPDIESLDASSDFTLFMRPGVPEHLRTLALRKLWRSDPIFSKLDGLVEYGEDYSIASWPKDAIKTAYKVGRGFLEEISEAARPDQAPPAEPGAPAPEEPAAPPARIAEAAESPVEPASSQQPGVPKQGSARPAARRRRARSTPS